MAVSGVGPKSSEIGVSEVMAPSLDAARFCAKRGFLTFRGVMNSLVKALRSSSSDVLSGCFSADVVQSLKFRLADKMPALTLSLSHSDWLAPKHGRLLATAHPHSHDYPTLVITVALATSVHSSIYIPTIRVYNYSTINTSNSNTACLRCRHCNGHGRAQNVFSPFS
jgi:hypothetical protein